MRSYLKARRFLLLFVMVLMISACSTPSPSEKTAEAFIRAYYVNHDQRTALNFANGLAVEKIREEMHLLQATSPASSQEMPEITYKKLSAQASQGQIRLVYQLRISVPELDRTIDRKVFLKLREQEGAWKVTQFGDDAGSR